MNYSVVLLGSFVIINLCVFKYLLLTDLHSVDHGSLKKKIPLGFLFNLDSYTSSKLTCKYFWHVNIICSAGGTAALWLVPCCPCLLYLQYLVFSKPLPHVNHQHFFQRTNEICFHTLHQTSPLSVGGVKVLLQKTLVVSSWEQVLVWPQRGNRWFGVKGRACACTFFCVCSFCPSDTGAVLFSSCVGFLHNPNTCCPH